MGSLERVEYFFEPPTLFSLFALLDDLPGREARFLFDTFLHEELLIGALSGRVINLRGQDDGSILHTKPEAEITRCLEGYAQKWKDEAGSASSGDTILFDARNSLVRAHDSLVALVGLDDIVVVSTKDATLVARKDRAQDAKVIAAKLKEEDRTEWELHCEVYRPRGKYDSVDRGEGYQVKQITLNPCAKLSVQMHHHRAEYWVVVSGTALLQR